MPHTVLFSMNCFNGAQESEMWSAHNEGHLEIANIVQLRIKG